MASSEHDLPLSTRDLSDGLPPGYPRITPSSPLRDFGPVSMDYERCAALHNEILTKAVRAGGGEMPSAPLSWWEARAPPGEVADTLHPSLIEFLKRAWDEDVKPTRGCLFFFLGTLKLPEGFFRDEEWFTADDPYEPGRFLKLYQSSAFSFEDDGGIFFDQRTMKATFITYQENTQLVTAHEWGWMPLEVILDSYLQMVDEGKVEAVSTEQVALLGGDPTCGVVKPWVIYEYTKVDVERATTAFKRLINAIESRIKDKKDSAHTPIALPWHDSETYNPNLLPQSSFTHEFLSAISNIKVSFRYIAPGIRFPSIPEFADQPITDFTTSPRRNLGQFPGNCPLRLFETDPAAADAARNGDGKHPIPREGHYLGLNHVAPGFYIPRVVQRWPEFWSNGCRLILPFAIGRHGYARKSNGEPLGLSDCDHTDENPKPRDARGDLYQAGITNGITDSHPVAIDKVLNNWAERVESGAWEVDADGVKGGIEKFREADTEEHWREYWIPPSW
ncbi:hypothetical protein BDW74DRAFT_169328 [Aspergillus multicolor]|uniref:uncharacterized protein n=1 Tax=Aspergillus multicolor TaxID=41759 RepID=UPI003CCD3EFA